MNNYFLTEEELVEMTELKQQKKQRIFLANNNIPFEITASGKPRVIRAKLEERHAMTSTPKRKQVFIPRESV